MRKYPALHRVVITVLKEVRKEAGFSQQELSRRVEEVINFVNMIEKNQHGVQITEFIALSVAVGLDPPELLARVMKAAGGRSRLRALLRRRRG